MEIRPESHASSDAPRAQSRGGIPARKGRIIRKRAARVNGNKTPPKNKIGKMSEIDYTPTPSFQMLVEEGSHALDDVGLPDAAAVNVAFEQDQC